MASSVKGEFDRYYALCYSGHIMKNDKVENFIKFLGTAGARFVVSTQLRASGGIWICLNNVNILVDPGPGSLVRVLNSKPKLNPAHLNAIYVSHRHIDHCNDASIMIEAMTEGGTKKRGSLLIPYDALYQETVIFPHTMNYLPAPPIILKEGEQYPINGINLITPLRHKHPVETYGCILTDGKIKIGYIADTAYFPELEKAYECDIVIMNVVLLEPRPAVQHLSLPDAELLITHLKPKVTLLTHFGMHLLRSKPWELTRALEEKTKLKVIAASDGLSFDLNQL